MEDQLKKNDLTFEQRPLEIFGINEIDYVLNPFSREDVVTLFEKIVKFKNFFQQNQLPNLDNLLTKLSEPAGKTSFLVFKCNKYITVRTENIAFFYVRNESSMMTCFDGQEYFVNYSLEQIQNLLTNKQFFRLNRQYLINFSAVKEVEHYFSRKLFVKLIIPVPDKLLISKEKSCCFLQWLEDR
jgi:two-component system response regulator LytT